MKSQATMSDSNSALMRGTQELLNRQPPEDYQREWTERIATRKLEKARGSDSVLVFRIGPEWLALPTKVFHAVAENCVVHSVPHRRNAVLEGLVNVRGELLICASLGALLGIPRATPAQDKGGRAAGARMLVAGHEGTRLAIPVDEVANVARFAEADLKPVPATLSHRGVPFTRGLLPWEGKAVGCLDEERLFRELDQSFS